MEDMEVEGKKISKYPDMANVCVLFSKLLSAV